MSTYVEGVFIEMMVDNFEDWIIQKAEDGTANGAQTSKFSQVSEMKDIDIKSTSC